MMKKLWLMLLLGLGFVHIALAQTEPSPQDVHQRQAMLCRDSAIRHTCLLPRKEHHTTCSLKAQSSLSDSAMQNTTNVGDRFWPAGLLLHTLPQEPGSNIFRWNWNPAFIRPDLIMRVNFIYENYILRHQISRQAIFKKVRIRNQIRRVVTFWQSGNFQLGLGYARRIKNSSEIVSAHQSQPARSYEEISDIISPTLGYRFSFGLALAIRTNFQKIRFIDQTPSTFYQNQETIRLTNWDLGVEQNIGNWLIVDIFSNEINESVNGERLSGETNFKIINVSTTVKWHNAWATAGLRLRRIVEPKDSLLFLHISYPLRPDIWLTLSYTQSKHYAIIDMDENLAAPIIILGSGISIRYKKFLFAYRIDYLRFSKIIADVNAEANFLDRNHFRHEFNIFLVW